MIESGHFRFHVVGDRILHLDLASSTSTAASSAPPRATLASGRWPTRSARAPPAPSPTRVAYAQACEEALGLSRTASWRVARTTAARARAPVQPPERHRARSAPASASRAGTMAFAALKERAQRLNAAPAPATASCSAACASAAATVELDATTRGAARGELARAARGRGGAPGASSSSTARCRTRLDGVGDRSTPRTRDGSAPSGRRRARAGIPRRPAQRTARASPTTASTPAIANRRDRRRRSAPRAARARARPVVRRSSTSCSAARSRPGAATGGDAGRDVGVGRVESPRGATICVVERDGGRRRARSTCAPAPTPTGRRSRHAAAGNLLPDFPLINKSFELCYACADR